ncbi:hypothetical protein SAMN04489860_1984 [Paraoerskovia marina]|uniref:SAV-6107-like HEPN domain-containing protein n=2 Tax=Paraoerskovia marina TaxID=545619 RepID=A0A1H1TSF4_9CELL|nr:hypothetical protein SAMN04489860_1984 [Paraoerskovia marina]
MMSQPTSRSVQPANLGSRGLVRADAELVCARRATDPAEKFLHAHLAAIRAASAVLEARGRPSPRTGARTVWEMLARVAPDLGRWSIYFASGAKIRAALDAGRFDVVDRARADELVVCAEDFRDEVALLLDPRAEFVRYPLHLVVPGA